MDISQAPILKTPEPEYGDLIFDSHTLAISIVVPIYNEVESLPRLIAAIDTNMADLGLTYELICVDDGSSDGSTELLKQQAEINPNLKAIVLRRNYGQTAAMAAGFKYSQGQVIITLDGDLQNDPQDIALLLRELGKGYDVVSGWRKNRQDDKLSRLLPSRIANWLISKMTGVQLHDYGCSLKAYRTELIADMNLYGELHRFLPALAFIEGAKITEIPVNHHARRFGQSKYGLDRTFRVVMDLLTISFIKKFLTRPMHVFGLLGISAFGVGIVVGAYLSFIRLVLGQEIAARPLLTLAVLMTLTGIQLFCFGLLAELSMRTYHESQDRPIYRVREVIESNGKSNNSKAH
ncbi:MULTISPECIES: glycosyltransferase family 2 protein [Planktothrix]|jgi:glycosyltransferase involved in cell wall biosynthesis|uniref:Dodecaprenyl-phosphate galacturonate synthase n=2 Tax=Planktothrix TaxID=54304 RepID=A0A1J1JLS7_PLAAG|nr:MULTISPECIES: glycosyltransferase family 2 protein [Planktothrix]MCF3607503.1 glycosyltransferase family 2 protein [Planktothrix agardhii 1033]BBD55574.1 glycosyl transferase family protein [Planktothrix agardhii NIES-204]MBG0745584.1 glycosyltransferase family 2 protein [Planktothrix agardhii KL2]MCB8751593.1 glycosyltransferase family 2 protein [Planktothrix agardhii 1810]MCB8760573.1 glycosyltransferase family 2 protein [Planktothrix agardhii 1813]